MGFTYLEHVQGATLVALTNHNLADQAGILSHQHVLETVDLKGNHTCVCELVLTSEHFQTRSLTGASASKTHHSIYQQQKTGFSVRGTNLIQGVVIGVVKAVGVSGLSETSSRLHLLLLLVQQHLQRVRHVTLWFQVSVDS